MKKMIVIFVGLATILLTMGCAGDPASVVLDGVRIEDTRLSTMAKDYFVGIAEGDIAGHERLDVFGYNGSVGGTEEDIWFGSIPYVFPTAPQRMELVGGVEDDPLKVDGITVGTGIHSVRIYYLDGNYNEFTEDVTLNGTLEVPTVTDQIFRVNKLIALTAGSTYKAGGSVAIRNTTNSPFYSYILAGFTHSRCSAYTVPAGKTLYITSMYVGVGGLNAANQARITLKSTYCEETNTLKTPGLFFFPLAELLTPNGNIVRDFLIPIRIPATADVKVSALSDAGSSFIEASYRGWIE